LVLVVVVVVVVVAVALQTFAMVTTHYGGPSL